jgi:tripartite-type tricarboxylate transporter receptor subunit TctC
VPYRGAGPASTDLLGDQVDFYFATPQTVVSFVKTGKLRALAVSSTKRLPVLPNVPTIAESGLKGVETSDWKLLVAPAGTPAEIIRRLNAEVEKAMSKPATLAQLLAEGSVPMSGSPQDAATYLKTEQQRWSAVVRESAAKVD